MDIATIMSIAQEYWLAITFLVVLIGAIIYKKVKAKKKGNKDVKVKPVNKGPINKPVPINRPVAPMIKKPEPVKQEDEFSELFKLEEEKEKKRKDVMSEIQNLNSDLSEDGKELDQQTRENFERLREELIAVNKRKEEIKQYGLGLANLFAKYRKRERYLTGIMSGMEQLMNQSKYREAPQNPEEQHKRLY
jgi:molecular chaperone DnaK (HSP70)